MLRSITKWLTVSGLLGWLSCVGVGQAVQPPEPSAEEMVPAALGEAKITLDAKGGVRIFGMGSSGNDGVSFPLIGPNDFRVELLEIPRTSHAESGSAVQALIMGTVDGKPDQVILGVRWSLEERGIRLDVNSTALGEYKASDWSFRGKHQIVDLTFEPRTNGDATTGQVIELGDFSTAESTHYFSCPRALPTTLQVSGSEPWEMHWIWAPEIRGQLPEPQKSGSFDQMTLRLQSPNPENVKASHLHLRFANVPALTIMHDETTNSAKPAAVEPAESRDE